MTGKIDPNSSGLMERTLLIEENKRLQNRIDRAIKETLKPTCASYEYDPTPTAEERLNNVRSILNGY